MAFHHVTLKIGNMRKAQEFTIYPASANDTARKLQSNTRMATVDLTTGKYRLTSAHAGGAYFVHLSFPDCMEGTLTAEQINAIYDGTPSASQTLLKMMKDKDVKDSGGVVHV